MASKRAGKVERNVGGRPTREGVASSAVFQIRCTPEEHQAWKTKAEQRGVVLADVVRDYLRRWAGQP